jgi:hypothetical protein
VSRPRDVRSSTSFAAMRSAALGREQGDLVAEEVGQERRAAGDELREAARVGLRDVDAGVTGIRVVQQRRRAAELSALLAQAARSACAACVTTTPAPTGRGRPGSLRRARRRSRLARRHRLLATHSTP